MSKPGEFFARDRNWHPPALTPPYKTSVARSPGLALISIENTLSEVTGPAFGHDDIDRQSLGIIFVLPIGPRNM